jgi:hypothetical protein
VRNDSVWVKADRLHMVLAALAGQVLTPLNDNRPQAFASNAGLWGG